MSLAETEPRIEVNGSSRVLRHEHLAGLVEELGLDPLERGIAIAHNGEVVPRREWERRMLAPGDTIEIVAAVQGG